MKKTPGPLAPPERSLPSRKITDLSYSYQIEIAIEAAKLRLVFYLNNFDDKKE